MSRLITDMIGNTLSHYHILEQIGQGGLGEVYREEDTKLALLAAWGDPVTYR